MTAALWSSWMRPADRWYANARVVGFFKANGGRVILSGDTRQHGVIEASDALNAMADWRP